MSENSDFIRYVNLDMLPKNSDGKINWKRSEGYCIPFIYDNISGEIKLIEYDKDKKVFKIFIEGYTRQQYDILNIDSIKQCRLGRVLHKKIIDTNPEMIQYFVDKNDAFKHSVQSNVRVYTKCPICGYIKHQIIANIYKFGFCCPRCSDGVSYPNKLMFNILKQLNVNFKNEITRSTPGFEWVGNYRYDFYFEKDYKKYFIEMDGHFHRNGKIALLVQENDIMKDCLAQEHDIIMIRIDCVYNQVSNRFNYVKTNIVENKLLNELLDLSIIDWKLANKYAQQSNISLAAEYWNDGHKISFIAGKLGVSSDTIRNYLKIATETGMCCYSVKESLIRRSHIS